MCHYGTYQRLGVTVHASSIGVIRAARKKLCVEHRTGRIMRMDRHKFYRMMLAHHSKAQTRFHAYRF